MRFRSSLVLLAALGAAPLLNGCVSLGAAAGASMGALSGQDRTFGETYNDNRAASSVKSALSVVDRVAFAHVGVEVSEGRLLLFGNVPAEEHRQTAELVARSARGVSEVYNEIEVGPAERAMRSAGDGLLAARVHTALISSASVRGIDVHVEAFHGNVYLMGAQRTDGELRRAAEIAANTPGVTRVVSLMTVREIRAPLATAQTFQPSAAPQNTTRQASASPY